MQSMCHTAFGNGITHFDLANNYGHIYGAAEENFGRILAKGLGIYRDELVISTKAGYDMWQEPYGDGGSKKYLVASLDQSLKRMGLDYVDIFYHHRPDRETPIEETARALDGIVRSERRSMSEFLIIIRKKQLQSPRFFKRWARRLLSTSANIPCLTEP